MIKYIIGDALNTDCDVLCHQVNLQGVMGGGIAKQISQRFPNVESEYVNFEKKLANVCFAKADKYVIANCFSQSLYGETDYISLDSCMLKVKKYMEEHNLESVAFPYKYGCGIAIGNWDKVLQIITNTLNGKTIKIYRLDVPLVRTKEDWIYD